MTASLFGQSVLRKEDGPLLSGAGRFTGDIDLPGQAHAVFVRSPHAHARVGRIDVRDAAAAPGVAAVLTAADYAADGMGPLVHFVNNADHFEPSKPAFGPETILFDPLPPQPPIAADTVRHVGEIVAVVIADSIAAAQDAAERVAVDYDPLPAVTDSRAALAPDAPRLWGHGNLCLDAAAGDRAATEAAFACAGRVVRLRSHNHRICAMPLEPRAVVAAFDAADGKFTVHCPSQGVHRHKFALMGALKVAEDSMRVVTPDVGGGFGVRSPCYPEAVLAAWAARRTGRPVKWTATRSESLVSDFQARDLHADAALALDADGRFLALRLDWIANLGAHPTSFAVPSNLMRMGGGPYDIRTVDVAVRGVVTNTLPVTSYRGAGRPEVTFVVERLIDMAAAEMGIDRLTLRRRNLIAPDALPYPSPLGHRYDSGTFAANMDAAAAAIGWDGFPARRAAAAARGRRAGIAVANYLESPTGAPAERTDVRVLPDGTVEAVIGTQASGQGHETSFGQVVASALEIPLDRVRIVFGDTDRAVSGGGSHSDRSMRLGSTVMVRAAADIVDQGRAAAAQRLEAAPADIVYADGAFRVAGTDRAVTLGDLAPLAATSEIATRLHAYPNGCAACEVEVDPETGAVAVMRYATVDDVGRIINPMLVAGQVHGGIAQGLGQALLEHCVYDPGSGQLLSGSLLDYGLPRADDLPGFDTASRELPAPSNPFGIKGAGECGTTPAAAAAIGAIADALRVAHIEMPATPERVWRALASAARDADGE
ncbi:MAG: xanthine dehydrogenase family protein molybdopterin-binding subunit [Rhodospirillales bacterium]